MEVEASTHTHTKKLYFSFTGPKGCIPIEKMRETNQAVRLQAHLMPTTSEAVQMYEEQGGRLNTDPNIGYDPIASPSRVKRAFILFSKLLFCKHIS